MTKDAAKSIDVKQLSRPIKKILDLEKMQAHLGAMRHKVKHRATRKRLGMPVKNNLGSPENKKMRRELMQRVKAVKHLKYLRKRGRLGKDEKLPALPDA